MKSLLLAIAVLLESIMVCAQHDFRTILDSTVACSYHANSRVVTRYFDPTAPNNYVEEITGAIDFFYIVEQMPVPEIQVQDLEKVLEDQVLFNEEERKDSGIVWFQCLVNCKGNAGDFQMIRCPGNSDNVCWQVGEVIKNELLNWNPGKQRGREVDVLILIRVNFYPGEFRVVAPISW